MKSKRITLYLQAHTPGEFVLTCPKFPSMRFPGSTPGQAVERFWRAWEEVQAMLTDMRQQHPDEFQVDP